MSLVLLGSLTFEEDAGPHVTSLQLCCYLMRLIKNIVFYPVCRDVKQQFFKSASR